MALISCITMSAHSQEPAKGQVLYASPDEYTSLLLGETDPPRDVAFLLLDSMRPTHGAAVNQTENSDPAPIPIDYNSFEKATLSEVEGIALATKMYFDYIYSDIEQLGKDNVERLLANGFELSTYDARRYVDFVESNHIAFRNFQQSFKVRKCNEFVSDVTVSGDRVALENIVKQERNMAYETYNFYSDALLELSRITNPSAILHAQNEIATISENVVSFRADPIEYLTEMGVNPVGFYVDHCR